MYSAIVFLLFVVMAIAAIDEARLEKCKKLNPGSMKCCTSTHISPEMLFLKEVKECFETPGPPLSCDSDECFAKKLGFYGDDGKIDKEALTSLLEKKFENDQPLLNTIKKNCLEIDIGQIYTDGLPMCDLLKMRKCLYIHFKAYCTGWSNEGDCEGIKELVDYC